MTDKCPFDTPDGCTALLCYDKYSCGHRESQKGNVIQQFADIEATGNLPAGFHWDSLKWNRKDGWMGWVVGPNGCNDLIKCRKLPPECGARLEYQEGT